MRFIQRCELFVATLVVSCGVLLPCVTRAFTVSPALIDQIQDPGTGSQGIVHLLNDTKQDQTFYVLAQNFVPQGEEGNQTFLPETDQSGLVSWISFGQRMVTIKAGSAVDFPWILTVPKDAAPGGHYAAIFFSTQPNNSSVGIGSKTGVLFLLSVTGQVTEAAKLVSFTVMPDTNGSSNASASWIDRLPALFEMQIENTGNVHVQPQGTLTITNMFGSVVDTVPVNPAMSRVLPASIRNIRSAWGPAPENARGFFANLQAEWRAFAFGRYTASLSAVYGASHQALDGSVAFWVLPWRIGVVVLCGFVVLLLLIKGYNRLVVKAAVSTAKPRN